MRRNFFRTAFAGLVLLAIGASCSTSSAQYGGGSYDRYGYGQYGNPYDTSRYEYDRPAPAYDGYEYGSYDGYDQGPVVEDVVDEGVFREELAPYGTWEEVPDYGACWVPANVAPGWQPYTVGNWAYTNYGWTWVSYEPFGWATYHYGRWAYLPGNRWGWVPGSVWGPAWVDWRYGDGYCGWAPLPPSSGFSISVGIAIGDVGYIPSHCYAYVAERDFCHRDIHHRIVRHDDNHRLYGRTERITRVSVDDHRVYNHGVDPRRIENATGRRVERTGVRPAKRPEDAREAANKGREVAVYRPRSTRDTKAGDRPGDDRRASTDRPTRPEAGSASADRIARPRDERDSRTPTVERVTRPDDRSRTPTVERVTRPDDRAKSSTAGRVAPAEDRTRTSPPRDTRTDQRLRDSAVERARSEDRGRTIERVNRPTGRIETESSRNERPDARPRDNRDSVPRTIERPSADDRARERSKSSSNVQRVPTPERVSRPEPARPAPERVTRPEPSRPAPERVSRPEPSRPAPERVSRPEPSRPAPSRASRPESASPPRISRPEAARPAPERVSRPEPSRSSPRVVDRPSPARSSSAARSAPARSAPSADRSSRPSGRGDSFRSRR